MSFTTKLVLLCAATSLLSQSAAGEAVVYPYNCDSTEPICQTDCITAVHNICAGLVIPLTTTQATTVRGCTAKYIPYQGAADTKATCFASFQKILDGSNAAAKKCDGKTLGRVGGVLAMDANNQFVKSTSYAIFPANNNPNCVVLPGATKQPVAARHDLLGTFYDCSSQQGSPSTTSSQLSRINTRDAAKAKCGISIAGAAVCSAACAFGVFAT